MKAISNDFFDNWEHHQIKTEPQAATLEAFGMIHDTNSIANIEKMIKLLQNVIDSLPSNHSELMTAQECYHGFVTWNNYWSESFLKAKIDSPATYAIQNVHIFHENWFK